MNSIPLVTQLPTPVVDRKDLPAGAPGIRPAMPGGDGRYWRVRRILTLTPHESRDLHHVYVRCFRNDARVVGVRVRWMRPDGVDDNGRTEDKPINEFGDWNGPMFGDWVPEAGPGPYSIQVADGASETAFGFGLPRKQHYSYIVEFEEVRPGTTPPPDPEPDTTTPPPLPTASLEARLRMEDDGRRNSLMTRLLRDGYSPVSSVFIFNHGGVEYRAQCALRLGDQSERIYYSTMSAQNEVRFLATS